MVRENGSGGHPQSNITVTNHDFEGGPLACIQMDGQAWFMARTVGDRLGYEEKGLTTNIGRNWADEMDEGVDYLILKGGRLKKLKSLVDDLSTSRTPSLMLLSREGVNMVCMLSKKPVGKRMRRWLASDVLPAIQDDGKYEVRQAPAPQQIPEDPKLMRERRLMLQMQAKYLEKAADAARAAGLLNEATHALQLTGVAELVTGRQYPEMKPEVTQEWYTPTQIAEELGSTANMVGRTMKTLGYRGNVPGFGRVVLDTVPATGKQVESYQYTREAIENCRERLIQRGKLKLLDGEAQPSA